MGREACLSIEFEHPSLLKNAESLLMAECHSMSINRDQGIAFDDFILDTVEGLLWKGAKKIHLRPKSFALLQHLVSHPGHLITKDQLLGILWPGTNVGDEALAHCVAEVRKALDDTAEKPRIIETAHRRGYRFIAQIAQQRTTGKKQENMDHHVQAQSLGNCQVVGRLSELRQLRQYLEEAISGVRQLVFVTGEQGIGKTTLVETFLSQMKVKQQNSRDSLEMALVSRGQCMKSRGAVEAYMPFYEILTTLCAGSNRRSILALLRRYAPLWLQQMPGLTGAAQFRPLRQAIWGNIRGRMLREIAEALEALTEQRPLVLVLEDLHWGDDSSLNLISYLVQRRRPARLLLIATYRPAEVMPAVDCPLRSLMQELQARQQCNELPLGFLDEIAVGEYLRRRFPGHGFPANTAIWFRQKAGGNPLFLVNILDHMVASGFIVQRDKHWDLDVKLEDLELTIPRTIQQIIERQIEMCTPQERLLLQAASVEGSEFSIAGVAAALGDKVDRIELRCRKLAQRNQFLQFVGIRGTPGGRHRHYRFIHALYQSICYQLLPEELQAQLHRRVGEFIEKTNTRRLGEVAARLAVHFDKGREYRSAIRYYLQAAQNANLAKAGYGGLRLAEQGVNLLEMIPDTPERKELEICLQTEVGRALGATMWTGATETGQAFSRARELFEELSLYHRSRKKNLLFHALAGLCKYHWARAECEVARELAEQMLHLAEAKRDISLLNQAHLSLGSIMVDLGEFTSALRHFKQSEDLTSRCRAEMTRWILGYVDQALNNLQAILSRVLETHRPEEHFSAYVAMAWLRFSRRESEKALESAQSAINLALYHGLDSGGNVAPMKVIRGWALAKLGQVNDGYEQVRQALAEFRAFGMTNVKPMVLMVGADISMDAGQIEQGLTTIDDALNITEKRGMRSCDAELYRMKGELLWQRSAMVGNLQYPEVEYCFERAIRIARQQRAKSFELRAITCLAKLQQKQNKKVEARERLARIYESITEGNDMPDMQKARELLQELS